MKLRSICLVALLAAASLSAQEVIRLYSGAAPGSEDGNYPEKRYFSNAWNTEVVTNVSQPTLTVYKPDPAGANGTSIVICPGGGERHESIGKVIPLSVADGMAAVTLVRKRATEWGLAPDRVGIIGFSAGGTVAAGTGFGYTPESRPAFVAPVYAATDFVKNTPVPADAPPMFLAAATDDQLNLAPDTIQLYNQWTAAHKSAELHMYAQGGHGFGMRQQGIPTDHWIERFGEWLDARGLLKK